MTEDTRKDKRAKIVSLNVRYKSATVDEFIENHSHDVSKGGIFIKTPTPFPPGTLIKFEIRIANDKAVIMGVGRVVWKREPSQSAGERPSGMGVKFIKIDDSSRSLIDRVVAEKEGAGASYATENEAGEAAVKAATSHLSDHPKPVSDRPKVIPGAPGSIRPGEVRKETIMGIGSAPPPRPAPKAADAGAMFPSTQSAPETGPVKEKTVMKQAAELLEEALKEAGGSMDEIGNNPLFTEGKAAPRVAAAEDPAKAKKATLIGMSAPSSGTTKAAKPLSNPPVEALASKTVPEAPKRLLSPVPSTSRETPSSKMSTDDTGPSSRQRKTDPPNAPRVAKSAAAAVEEPKKKSGSSGVVWVLALVLVAGGVAFVYKDNLLGAQPNEPAPTAAPPPVAIPAPVPTPEPSAAASAAPSAAATASTAPSASAPSASASASAPTPSASASGKAATTASATLSATAASPAPAPKPTPPATPKPAPTPAAAATDTAATPPPAPKPKPKPKPTAPSDDNPY
jgi:uncharacterized protein (TIGR02266 family)